MMTEPVLSRPPPFRNSRLSGNGATGGAFTVALTLEYPKLAVFSSVGEKICVSCVLKVYRLVCASWRNVGSTGLRREPRSVVSEHEHLVLANRPSQRSSKLVPLELWYRGRVWRIGHVEEVPRVQRAVAQILENRP